MSIRNVGTIYRAQILTVGQELLGLKLIIARLEITCFVQNRAYRRLKGTHGQHLSLGLWTKLLFCILSLKRKSQMMMMMR